MAPRAVSAPAKVVPPQAANAAPVTSSNQSSAVSHGTPGPKHGGFVIPAIVVLTAFCGARSWPDRDWVKWLPHTSSAHSPVAGPHLAAGAESAVLLGQFEDPRPGACRPAAR